MTKRNNQPGLLPSHPVYLLGSHPIGRVSFLPLNRHPIENEIHARTILSEMNRFSEHSSGRPPAFHTTTTLVPWFMGIDFHLGRSDIGKAGRRDQGGLPAAVRWVIKINKRTLRTERFHSLWNRSRCWLVLSRRNGVSYGRCSTGLGNRRRRGGCQFKPRKRNCPYWIECGGWS